MTISILTLFPKLFLPFCKSSIIGRSQKKGLVDINIVDIRDFATDPHKTVDDRPYGGGTGMILRVDILHKALVYVKQNYSRGHKMRSKSDEKVILLDPTGKIFTQPKARQLLQIAHIILICGHYEGIDARIDEYVDEKISIGKYILTGGEIPSMAVTDAIIRLLPGVLAKSQATEYESFSIYHTYEYPQYTRPKLYEGHKVPDILLSGNHLSISSWRSDHAKKR